MISLNQKTGDLTDLATSYSNLGSLYSEAQQPQKGLEAYEQALSIRMQLPDEISQAQTRINLATALANIGLIKASLQHLELAFRVIQKADSATMQQLHVRAELGQRHFALGEYAQALEYFNQACQLAQSMNHWALPIIQANRTYLLLMLGQIDIVKEQIAQLKTNATIPPIHKMTILKSEIALCNFLGLENGHLETQIRQCNAPELATAGILLELQRPTTEQVHHAQKYLEQCHITGLLGRENYGLIKNAQALLPQNPSQALEASTRAYLQHQTHQALGHFCNEINWVHYQALQANQRPEATQVLQEAHKLLLEQHAALPLEYQESFLTYNPINKAILKAARAAGLAVD